jgi:hypothetical protein
MASTPHQPPKPEPPKPPPPKPAARDQDPPDHTVNQPPGELKPLAADDPNRVLTVGEEQKARSDAYEEERNTGELAPDHIPDEAARRNAPQHAESHGRR